MKIKGFTPIFDSLSQKYDPYTALVYGKIWRICDWSDMRMCTMSNEKIAKQIGLSEKTVRRKKEILSEDGLIKVVGKTGTTDTVTVCHDVVMEMELDYTSDSGGISVDFQSKTSDGESYKDSNSKTVKKDIIQGMVDYSGDDELQGVPPIHAELMLPFCEFYRYPFPDEVKTWISQVDVWLSRGYKPQNVVSACKYVEERKDWEYFQPASILKAFGKGNKTSNDLEVENERLKRLHK